MVVLIGWDTLLSFTHSIVARKDNTSYPPQNAESDIGAIAETAISTGLHNGTYYYGKKASLELHSMAGES